MKLLSPFVCKLFLGAPTSLNSAVNMVSQSFDFLLYEKLPWELEKQDGCLSFFGLRCFVTRSFSEQLKDFYPEKFSFSCICVLCLVSQLSNRASALHFVPVLVFVILFAIELTGV